MTDRVKVFCIGFHRTGTRSLSRFLEDLGYKTCHYPAIIGGVEYEASIRRCVDDRAEIVSKLLPVLDQFDAFSDVPFPALYSELFDLFPKSRFILTTRNLDDWWRSVVRHKKLIESNRGVVALNPFEFAQYNRHASSRVQFFSLSDEQLMKDIHKRHIESVSEFFEGKPSSLLKFDIEDPEANKKIGDFLDVSSAPSFPNTHQGRGKYTPRRRGWSKYSLHSDGARKFLRRFGKSFGRN